MNFMPLQDRVLVKLLPQETTSPGGIVLPDTAKGGTLRGQVVDFGPECSEAIEIGYVVEVVADALRREFAIDGEKHAVISEDDVLGYWIK